MTDMGAWAKGKAGIVYDGDACNVVTGRCTSGAFEVTVSSVRYTMGMGLKDAHWLQLHFPKKVAM